MARIRSLKPGFCTSPSIAQLTIPCRLHFAMLWTYADDNGRGVDNGRLVKAALWPLDDEVDIDQVERWQDELHVKGRIIRYRDDDRRYFEIVNFTEHQHPNRRVKSLLPEPSVCELLVSTAQTLFEHNSARNGSGGRGAVVVDGEEPADAPTAPGLVDNPVPGIRDYLRSVKDATTGASSDDDLPLSLRVGSGEESA